MAEIMHNSRQAPYHCEWCHREVVNDVHGRRRKYCSQSCRQRAYEARHELRHSGIPEGSVLLSKQEANDAVDRMYMARCAAEDLMQAIEDECSFYELDRLAEALVDRLREAERLR